MLIKEPPGVTTTHTHTVAELCSISAARTIHTQRTHWRKYLRPPLSGIPDQFLSTLHCHMGSINRNNILK